MSTTFVRALPAQHPIRTLGRNDAVDMLSADHRVVGVKQGATVPELREWCAATVWISSHPALTADDVVLLSVAQRDTLGAMLEVDTTRGVIETAGLLVRAILGTPSDTFLSIMATVRPDLATMSRAETDAALNNTSFNYDPVDLGDAREACALKAWLLDVFTTADDFKALPANLRDWARMLHGVNSAWDGDTIATTVLSLVDKWKSSRRRRAARTAGAAGAPQPPPAGGPPPLPGAGPAAPNPGGAPPPPPFPSPNAGGALFPYHPPFGYPPYGYGFFPPPPPPPQPPPPPPPPQYPGGAPGAGGPGADGGGAQAQQQLGAGGAGPLGSFPLYPNSGAWPPHLSLAQRAEGQRELDRILSIAVQSGNLISERERKHRIQENKLLPQGAQPVDLPYSAYPAKQRLVIADGDMFDPARYARMMRIALTCDSPAFTDATDTLLRSTRKERETRLATDFDKHFQLRQASAALLVIESVKQHCREQMQIIEQRARGLAATYQHPSLIEYAQDRER